jgi:hypothetical protein
LKKYLERIGWSPRTLAGELRDIPGIVWNVGSLATRDAGMYWCAENNKLNSALFAFNIH